MMKIAVTKIAPLLGKHIFKRQCDAIKDLITYRTPNKKLQLVKKELLRTSFYNWFTGAKCINGKMKRIWRSIIEKCCKKHNLIHRKPYTFWSQQRGIVRESFNIRILPFKVTDHQKCIQLDRELYTICGRIDGLHEKNVIEIKSRSSCIQQIPISEKIQLVMYCHILRMPGQLWSFYNNDSACLDMTLEAADDLAKRCLLELDKKMSSLINSFMINTTPFWERCKYARNCCLEIKKVVNTQSVTHRCQLIS